MRDAGHGHIPEFTNGDSWNDEEAEPQLSVPKELKTLKDPETAFGAIKYSLEQSGISASDQEVWDILRQLDRNTLQRTGDLNLIELISHDDKLGEMSARKLARLLVELKSLVVEHEKVVEAKRALADLLLRVYDVMGIHNVVRWNSEISISENELPGGSIAPRELAAVVSSLVFDRGTEAEMFAQIALDRPHTKSRMLPEIQTQWSRLREWMA